MQKRAADMAARFSFCIAFVARALAYTYNCRFGFDLKEILPAPLRGDL